jgi:hypothetical protein
MMGKRGRGKLGLRSGQRCMEGIICLRTTSLACLNQMLAKFGSGPGSDLGKLSHDGAHQHLLDGLTELEFRN